jgi:hypothetical protein
MKVISQCLWVWRENYNNHPVCMSGYLGALIGTSGSDLHMERHQGSRWSAVPGGKQDIVPSANHPWEKSVRALVQRPEVSKAPSDLWSLGWPVQSQVSPLAAEKFWDETEIWGVAWVGKCVEGTFMAPGYSRLELLSPWSSEYVHGNLDTLLNVGFVCWMSVSWRQVMLGSTVYGVEQGILGNLQLYGIGTEEWLSQRIGNPCH